MAEMRDTGPFCFLIRKFGFDYARSVPHLIALPNFLSIVVVASNRQHHSMTNNSAPSVA